MKQTLHVRERDRERDIVADLNGHKSAHSSLSVEAQKLSPILKQLNYAVKFSSFLFFFPGQVILVKMILLRTWFS